LSSKRSFREAGRELLATRAEAIQALLKVVESQAEEVISSSDGPKEAAARLLGIMRAPEAVPVLMKHLRWLPEEWSSDELVVLEANFKCAVALVAIGVPSLPAVTQRLAETTDEEEMQVCAWIVMNVMGRPEGLTRLRRAERILLRQEEEDEDEKDIIVDRPVWTPAEEKRIRHNFRWAINYVQNYRPDFRLPKKLRGPDGHENPE